MYKIIVTLVYGQFGQTLYQNMRKDFKYAQRLQAAFGHPKDPGAASGRLKVWRLCGSSLPHTKKIRVLTYIQYPCYRLWYP